jgi:RNA polymerase sigma-70 factor, ECF subfamily
MNDTAGFEAQRPHLLGLAYRMLGEMPAAEDVVQEAWLRWAREDRSDIREVRAWLSTATVRLALDALRKIRARRENYIGPWLPEPILPDDTRAFAVDGPAAHAELASDLSLALLHVLERLSPEERAAFILHDAFDCDYPVIAETLEKSEATCRKLVSRARERVKNERPRYTASSEAHRDLLMRFAQATLTRDADALASLFSPDAILYSDGGGKMAAALNPIYGPDKITRLVLGLTGKFDGVRSVEPMEINGRPGLILRMDGRMDSTLNIETDGTLITAVYLVRNPDKLGRVERVLSGV